MTGMAIRHTLSALAALALASAFVPAASDPAAAAKSGNGFGEIQLTRITAGGIDNNKLGNTQVDAGLYGSDSIFLPTEPGTKAPHKRRRHKQ